MTKTSPHWYWLLILPLFLLGWAWYYNCQLDREQAAARTVPVQVPKETTQQMLERFRREAYWGEVTGTNQTESDIDGGRGRRQRIYVDNYLQDHGWKRESDTNWYNPRGEQDNEGAGRMRERALREMALPKYPNPMDKNR